MKISDLKPAGQLSDHLGVKALVYGPPGSGKTPVAATAPRPVMLATEPGLLSLRGSNMPTKAAATGAEIDDFFEWFFKSNETKNFDTLIIDSASQMAETYLQDELNGTSKGGNKKHGLQAYGAMAESVMKQLRPLYHMREKHCYVICKQSIERENGIDARRPYFPGNLLNIEVPHLYDLILHLGIHNIPGVGQHQSFQCRQSIDIMARDRSGRLDEFEPPNFGNIVAKIG